MYVVEDAVGVGRLGSELGRRTGRSAIDIFPGSSSEEAKGGVDILRVFVLKCQEVNWAMSTSTMILEHSMSSK